MNLKDYQEMSLENQLAYANERLANLKADGKKTTDYDDVYAQEGLKYNQIYKVLHKVGYRMDKSLGQFVLKYAPDSPTEVAATTQAGEMVDVQETMVPTPALTEFEVEQLKALIAKVNPMSFEAHIKDNAMQEFSATTVRVRSAVLSDWNEFCRTQYGYYNQSDVLTAALVEFMIRYGDDK